MPMTFEEFKKMLAAQGGALPSPWSGPEVQTPQQIVGDAAQGFKNRPPLEEMVPWADPVKRGVATPDMVAEQGKRDELMQNAVVAPNRKRGFENEHIEPRKYGELKNRAVAMQENTIKPYLRDDIYSDLLKSLAKEKQIKSITKSDISPSVYVETPSDKKIRISNHAAPPSSWNYKKPYTDINPTEYMVEENTMSLSKFPEYAAERMDDFLRLEKWLRNNK